MSTLFISYRRQDAAAYAGRLHEALAERYGEQQAFLDLDALPLGASFAEQLHRAVAECELMLVVIGPQWLDATDARGRRRLDDPDDFIRARATAGQQPARARYPSSSSPRARRSIGDSSA